MKRNEVERQEPQAPSTNEGPQRSEDRSDLPLDEAALDDLEVAREPLDPWERDVIAQSRAALALAARVAELEGELARAKWDVAARNAHANALRDALESGNRRLGYWCDLHGSLPEDVSALAGMQAALASTPAASLAAYRKSVLEEAAKMLDERASACGSEAPVSATVYRTCSSEVSALAAQEVKP